MSRDKRYQRLLNDKRWQEVKRIVWQRANGLCEQCYEDGIREHGTPYLTPGVDCHHIRPVESVKTLAEMEALCYNPQNVRLLCVPCHIKVHKEMRSHTRDEVKANRQRRLDRWIERMTGKFQPEQPKPYGEKADDYLRDLEARAKAEMEADQPPNVNNS